MTDITGKPGVPWSKGGNGDLLAALQASVDKARAERIKAKAEQLATIYQRPEGADGEIGRYVEGEISPTGRIITAPVPERQTFTGVNYAAQMLAAVKMPTLQNIVDEMCLEPGTRFSITVDGSNEIQDWVIGSDGIAVRAGQFVPTSTPGVYGYNPPTGPHCGMGVGCDESGVCYAEAHGEPDRCESTAVREKLDVEPDYQNEKDHMDGEASRGPA